MLFHPFHFHVVKTALRNQASHISKKDIGLLRKVDSQERDWLIDRFVTLTVIRPQRRAERREQSMTLHH